MQWIRHCDWLLSALAILLLASWFITSSDSGTLVITTMLSLGDDNPPKVFRVIRGLGDGFVAGVPLLAGGFGALRTASTVAPFPISLVLLAMPWGLFKSLAVDPGAVGIPSDAIAPDGARMSQELHA